MLLNYLLCFSILIMSAIKTADLFKKSNSSLHRTKSEFIRLTRQKHNQGSLSLNGALFAVLFSFLLLFFAVKFRVELQEARYRRNSYLCMHYLNVKTANYIFDLTTFNWLLKSAYLAMHTGAASAQALASFKTLQAARDARHLFYLKEIFSYRYCSKEMSSPALFSLPYETRAGLLLDTNVDQTTKLKEKIWKMTIYKSPAGIRFKQSFCLVSTYQMDGVLKPNLKTTTTEISSGAISKLKCLSGFR